MTDDSIRAESKIRTADKQMKSDYDRALSAAGKRDSVNVSKGAAPTTKQQMQLNAMKASITKRVRERGAK
jgi:hypothetical protein